MSRNLRLLSVAFAFCFATGTLFAQPQFFQIEAPAGGLYPELNGLSPDGTVAVGHYYIPDQGLWPMRWTAAEGSVDISGDVTDAVEANCCSGGGLAILGFGRAGPWRWTAETGIVPLPPAPGSVIAPYAVSEDGLAVCGSSADTSARAFRWTEAVGYQNIPVVGSNPLALEMSADGSTIVGVFLPAGTFLWRAGQGTTEIPLTGEYSPYAMGVSYDGRYVVSASNRTAARYDTTSEEVTLLTWPDGTPLEARAVAVSQDGETIVANAHDDLGVSYLWDPVRGARVLTLALRQEYGLDVGIVNHVRGMSADGAVIAGKDWVVNLRAPQPYTGRPPCQGDIDGDGRVGLTDLALVLAEWRRPQPTPQADLTGDGIVDQLDLNIVLLDFGDNCTRILMPDAVQ